jgi:hypothetical protein
MKRRPKQSLLHLAFAAGRDYVAQPTYHGDPGRSGPYVVPGLAWQRATQAHMNHSFDGGLVGQVVAQPLYWRARGSTHGLVIVATEADIVYGLDAVTGRAAWHTVLGAPVPNSLLPCGNLDPVGITGTPVIDPRSGETFTLPSVPSPRDTGHRTRAAAPADRR